jgi:hypothetical protein
VLTIATRRSWCWQDDGIALTLHAASSLGPGVCADDADLETEVRPLTLTLTPTLTLTGDADLETEVRARPTACAPSAEHSLG